MNPTQSQVHVDAALTNISVAYMQNAANFVAGRVFPNVPVMKQSDRYFVYSRADFNRDEAEKRAPGSRAPGGGFNLDNTPTYFADVWAFRHDISDQIVANQDAALNLERSGAEYVTQTLLIRKEVSWASNYFTSGVWDTDITGVASSPATDEVIQWSDQTSGDPIGDIRAAKTVVMENTGREANTLVLGQHVMDALTDHPDIVDRVKYSGGVGNGNPASVNEQTLAALFGIERVMVAKAVKNTAKEGATEASSFILGKNALLCHAAPAPGLMIPSAGYTFSWQGYLGTGNAFGMAMKNYYLDEISSTVIEGEMAFDHKVVSSDLGYMWNSIAA